MGKVGYAIVKLWADFMSVHPFWLLYLKSDFYFFLTYHVFRYRRKVVRENLLRSFPDKDLKSIKAIEKRFYLNLCDLVVEVRNRYAWIPRGLGAASTTPTPK